MNVKEDVLKLLEQKKGIYISGEEIAKELNVSRTAVWKAVNTLNEEGYSISGINKLGYCLNTGTDILSVEGILRELPNEQKDKFDIRIYKTVSSTNTLLKKMASEGEAEWTVVLAKEQTEGKGRMNRKFYSPSDTGIYMSILLRPDFAATESLFITTMAAVAVAEGIDDILHTETKIKWVNDIYQNDKKVCGILTEASINVENAKLEYAVLGIGINVKEPKTEFPEEIRHIAGSLGGEKLSDEKSDNLRNRLIADILVRIYNYYLRLDRHEFMSKYKEKSMLIGKEVYILSDKEQKGLQVLDIDENAALVVQDFEGNIQHISSGEVSVRLKQPKNEFGLI